MQLKCAFRGFVERFVHAIGKSKYPVTDPETSNTFSDLDNLARQIDPKDCWILELTVKEVAFVLLHAIDGADRNSVACDHLTQFR